MPPLDAVLECATVVSSPMRIQFRGVLARESVLFEGPSGWGEFCAFPEYDDAEAADWLACALEAAYGQWPAPVRTEVAVNATVPAVPAEQVPEVIARFDGATTAKIKVAEPGQTLADDVARVSAVRDCLGPGGHLRVDANGAWSVAEALEALTVLSEFRLQYVEQPCRSVEELVELREKLRQRGITVPIAADESIRRAEDPFRVARMGAADIAVLKVAPLGGVAAAVEIATRLFREFGMRLVISSALETSVGMAAGVAAACAVPDQELACGLGTVNLFTDEPGERRLVPCNGVICPGRISPDVKALRELAVHGERRTWWLDRLSRCYAVLARRDE